MTELRAQVNVRLTADINVGIALTRIVATEAEAEEFGADHAKYVTAYLAGYGRGAEEGSA